MKITAASEFITPVLVALGLLASGCAGGSRTVSMSAWQKNIEHYVKEHGNGDPAVLRDLRLPDSRRGFSMLGSDRPPESSDANGLLLGYHHIEGRNWFIYIVGLVQAQQVEAIQLAALTTDGGKYQWKVGENDRDALAKYRDHNEKLWRQRFPQRSSPPPAYLGFPRAEDQFQMTVSDGLITVRHALSGAQWELKIPPAPRAKVASVY